MKCSCRSLLKSWMVRVAAGLTLRTRNGEKQQRWVEFRSDLGQSPLVRLRNRPVEAIPAYFVIEKTSFITKPANGMVQGLSASQRVYS